jgi:hypothetical protein
MWTQQGSQLIGTGAIGKAGQGSSVSINSDGTTVAVGGSYDGGPYDNGYKGAVWIFNR